LISPLAAVEDEQLFDFGQALGQGLRSLGKLIEVIKRIGGSR